jgi:hypothetical protein
MSRLSRVVQLIERVVTGTTPIASEAVGIGRNIASAARSG